MSQRSIEAGRSDEMADIPSARRDSQEATDVRKDLLPVMAVLGAVYGWVFALLAAVVAVIVLLVS